jgi:AbrB family looped-hinge helix DNA binding protein
LSHTLTEKGTVTIPAEIRKKYRLRKGSRVEFVETDEGVLLVPVVPLEELHGADSGRKETVYRMIRELQEERREEAPGEE